MFGTLMTAPVRRRSAPGRTDCRRRASSLTRTPAVAAASVTASAMSFATASGPPCRGVPARLADHLPAPGPSTTAWIFVPPRSTPPRSAAVTRATARRRRAAAGSRGRSTPRPLRRRGVAGRSRQAEREDDRGRLVLRELQRPRAARRDPRCPFGQDAMPSFQAASSMFCAARPASNETGPFPVTTTATTSPAPSTLSGTKTVAASASTRARLPATTNVHGCRFDAEPARRPASRIRVTTSSGAARAGSAARRGGSRSRGTCPPE